MSIFNELIDKLIQVANSSNLKGIPFPLLRDPNSGKGSYTLTMFWISFNIAIVSLIGKLTNYLGNVDYNNVLWLLGITGGFYLGRTFKGDGKKIEVEGIGKSDGV